MYRTVVQKIALVILVLISTLLSLFGLEVLLRTKEMLLPAVKLRAAPSMGDISRRDDWQKVLKEKEISANTFNIYYFGESSMLGEPYHDTIPQMVEKMLDGQVDGKKLRWINMSSVGIPLSVVRERVIEVLDNKEIFHPSYVVIYAGHDEFLPYHDGIGFSFAKNDHNPVGYIVSRSRLAHKVAKALKLYRLEIDERHFFDSPVVSSEKYQQVLNNYDQELHSIISRLTTSKIPVVISTTVSNYSEFEPNRSVYAGPVDKKEQFENYMIQGKSALSTGDTQVALENFLQASNIDKNFANTNYQLGKVYQLMGKYEDAWEKYSQAVDQDMMPIRAVSAQNSMVKSLPQNDLVKVVDSLDYMRKSSKDSLIGYNFFSDGHHPNLEGYRLISELFAKKIKQSFSIKTSFHSLSRDQSEKMFNNPSSLYNVYASRADWLIRLSTWTYDPAERLSKADEYLSEAHDIYSNVAGWYLAKMTIAYLRGQVPEARDYFTKADTLDHQQSQTYIRGDWIHQVITRAIEISK